MAGYEDVMYVMTALASAKGLEEDTLREALLTLETKVSISDFTGQLLDVVFVAVVCVLAVDVVC